jgi:CheY-like chemotaxis protein
MLGAKEEQEAGLTLEPGEYVLLQVTDTGGGIPPQVLQRIFEPYFTTKAKGEGTGLGLSVAHSIIKASQGQITVHSELGRGTCFRVYLPMVADLRVPLGELGPDALPTGSERVLVVDDDEAIAIMLKALLERLGYRVTALTESMKALAMIEQDPAGFDLLITDMTMPTLTGYELSRKVLAARPGMPIILCTGYSELIDKEQAYSLGIRAFIMKPLSVRELSLTIRQVLNHKA